MLSTIVFCVLMLTYAIACLMTIMSIGKERKPLTPADVVIRLVAVGLLVWAISANWGWS